VCGTYGSLGTGAVSPFAAGPTDAAGHLLPDLSRALPFRPLVSDDPAPRERLGHKRVGRLVSVRANAPTYPRVLDSVVGRGRPAPSHRGAVPLGAVTSPSDHP
jgi:hypothetical protein